MAVHTEFVTVVAEQLKSEGYTIIGREVPIDDIVISSQSIRVDLIVKKDGRTIPVECGKIQSPSIVRVAKLKEKFGAFMHVAYGNTKRVLQRSPVPITALASERRKEFINLPLANLVPQTKQFTTEHVKIYLSTGERTRREIMDTLGCSKSTAEKLINELVSSGKLNKRNLRTEKKPMWFYSLKYD